MNADLLALFNKVYRRRRKCCIRTTRLAFLIKADGDAVKNRYKTSVGMCEPSLKCWSLRFCKIGFVHLLQTHYLLSYLIVKMLIRCK
jgi:hypothetical protein